MTARTTTVKTERLWTKSLKSQKSQLFVIQVDYMSDESSDSDEEEEEKADAKGWNQEFYCPFD